MLFAHLIIQNDDEYDFDPDDTSFATVNNMVRRNYKYFVYRLEILPPHCQHASPLSQYLDTNIPFDTHEVSFREYIPPPVLINIPGIAVGLCELVGYGAGTAKPVVLIGRMGATRHVCR